MSLSKNSLPYSMSRVAKETSKPTLGNDSLQTGMTSPTGKQYIEYIDLMKKYRLDPSEYIIESEDTKQRKIHFAGDFHGDEEKLLKWFQRFNLIDNDRQWIGGNDYVFIDGDFMARWKKSLQVVSILLEINDQAIKVEGKIILMVGNHEFMIYLNVTTFIHKDDILLEVMKDKESDNFKTLKDFLINLCVAAKVGSILISHSGLTVETAKHIMETNRKFRVQWEDIAGQLSDLYSSNPVQYFNDATRKWNTLPYLTTNLNFRSESYISPIWNAQLLGKKKSEFDDQTRITAINMYKATNDVVFVLAHTFHKEVEKPSNNYVLLEEYLYNEYTKLCVVGLDYKMSRFNPKGQNLAPINNERLAILTLEYGVNLNLQFTPDGNNFYTNKLPYTVQKYDYEQHLYQNDLTYPTQKAISPQEEEEEEDIYGVVPRGSQTGAPEEVKEEDDTPQEEEDIWGEYQPPPHKDYPNQGYAPLPPKRKASRNDDQANHHYPSNHHQGYANHHQGYAPLPPKRKATRALPSLPTTHYPNQGYAPLPPKRKSSLNDDQANHHYPSNHHQGYGSQEKRLPYYGFGQRTRFY